MRIFSYLFLTAALSLALFQACKKSGSGSSDGPDSGDSFDRLGMLSNVSTHIIVPAYAVFQEATANLDEAVAAFTASPDPGTLAAAQTALKAAYLQWQSASAFSFGPADQANLRANIDTYPADEVQINNNISSGAYDPGLLANLAAKGLPALDYLLFGLGDGNTAILQAYTTDAKAANRKSYLTKLSAEMKTLAAGVYTAWNSTYKNTFDKTDGLDVGSSTGQLVNQLVFDYEVLKNYEVGIPAGVQSMGAAFPEKVQAYYSGQSVQLALAHIRALQALYLGNSSQQADGLGLDDYLRQVGAKYSDGRSLDEVIKAQFASGIAKLEALPDPLSEQIKTNLPAVTATYTELQKLTVLLKTDMTSSLGILITYGDNDGD